MQKYILAGISGYRPELRHDIKEERCSVTFSGYGEDIAILPMNTVDAVLTPKGMLVYQDDRNEVRSLPLPCHERIIGFVDPNHEVMTRGMTRQQALSALGASVIRKPNMQDAVALIQRDAITMAHKTRADFDLEQRSLIGNTVCEDRIVASPNTDVTEEAVMRMIRPILEKHISDLTRQVIDPLRKRIAAMSEENRRLAVKLDEMEDAKRKLSTASVAPEKEDAAGYSLSWGDRSGLPGGLSPNDNPFSPRTSGR